MDRRERCVGSGISSSKWHKPETSSLGPMQKRTHRKALPSNTQYCNRQKAAVDTTRPGNTRDRSCFCRPAGSQPSSSIWQMKLSSMAAVFHSQHGSDSGRQPTALDAAWSCLVKLHTHSRALQLFLSVSPIRIDVAAGTVIRGFSYSASRGRVRFSPLASITRKPPASTWSDTSTLESREARMTNQSNSLYAAIHAAEFPAQAILRLRPDLHVKPVAILDGVAPQERVCSLNLHARKRGVVTA